MAGKPDILPFFPLSLFLLPGEDAPLHIFEPRYTQLIDDVKKGDLTFAIPYINDREIEDMGCEVRLKEVVAEKPDGGMVIVVESVAIIRTLSFHQEMEGKGYAGGAITRLSCSDPIESSDLLELIEHFRDAFDPEFLSCCRNNIVTLQEVIRELNLSSGDKFSFVRIRDNKKKEDYLAKQLRYLEMIRKQELLLGSDFGLN
jgi:hypothetical protein